MAFADQLVHRLEVLRRKSETDRMGQPRERWDSIATGVHCRITAPGWRGGVGGSGERNTERMRETYEVTHRVFLQDGKVDVGEDDEVIVTDQDGDDVLPRARIVLKRIVYAGAASVHHLELDCEALRGPL